MYTFKNPLTPVISSIHAQFNASMPSLSSSLLSVLLASTRLFPMSRIPLMSAQAKCPLNGPLSCQNTTAVADTCCFNAPGGQLLQTQFWDADPPTGPSDSWTVHGLWPDHCDGTYDATCDPNRVYTNVTAILQSGGASDLLSIMQTYWKDYQGDDQSFWSHEWSKHGTCISTLDPKCYASTSAPPQQDVIDFFNTTVHLFQQRNTYALLAAAGILPSTTKTYKRADVETALKAGHDGKIPTVNCQSGKLNEVWWHFNVRGSVQDGTFVPADPDAGKSTCPDSFGYVPKGSSSGGGSTTPTKTTTSTAAPPNGTGIAKRGTLVVSLSEGAEHNGCLISDGAWFTSGTCATFTAATSSPSSSSSSFSSSSPSSSSPPGSFTLRSSKGFCAIDSANGGAFTCGSGVSEGFATSFSLEHGSGKLQYASGDGWSADGTPVKGSGDREAVYVGRTREVDVDLVWKAV